MKIRRTLLGLLTVSSLLAAQADAASLTPYQQAALKKLLATVPPEQRDMVRPQFEATLASLNKQQVDMMVASMAANTSTPEAAEPSPGAQQSGEWGKAEADFDKAFVSAEAYMGRISDLHDGALKHWDQVTSALHAEWAKAHEDFGFTEDSGLDTCKRELIPVPVGRSQMAVNGMRGVTEQQDRLNLRTVIDLRARYKSASAVPPQLPQDMRGYFAPPMSEADVRSALQTAEREMAALLEASSRERHKIVMAAYPDSQPALGSPMRDRDLAALAARTTKAAAPICTRAREAYQRGIVAIIDPVTVKVRAQRKD